MIDISVIIVNYNTKEVTLNCINSVFDKTKDVSFEIIIVDNGSTDGSIELFSQDERVKFVETHRNLGFGKANNLGFKYAKGQYIFLLNSDTILVNDAISILKYKMDKADKDVACLGCYLLNKNMEHNQSFGHFLTIKRCLNGCVKSYYRKLLVSHDNNFWGDYIDYMDVEVIIGADLFIRRTTIEELGMFNPAFFMYHEENDMQRRYYSHGYKSQLVKGPQIIHLENISSSTMSSMRKKIMGEGGLFTYMRMWNSKYNYLLFKYLYLLLKLPIIFDKKYIFADRFTYIKHLLKQ